MLSIPDARGEAFERAGGRYDVRVLEPSPPANADPPWWADDPVNAPVSGERPVVSPVANGDVTWDQLASDDAELAEWCADRWLGAWRPLTPVGDIDAFVTTRVAWHALAVNELSPAREAATGKIGLRYVHGGIGTPWFTNAAGNHTQLSHLGHATGPEWELVEWYGFGCSVLEELRHGQPDAGATRVQLWPEHFDLSIDLGNADSGARGTFGASPGDDKHPAPYLYVTHWADVTDDPYWNDTAFAGASFPHRDLTRADGRATALEFLRAGLEILTRGGQSIPR